MKLLGFQIAARRAEVSVPTLHRWRAEGMRVKRDGARLLVDLEVVLAWKRWKALRNPSAAWRRRNAAVLGVRGAVPTAREFERARLAWIEAGGRDVA